MWKSLKIKILSAPPFEHVESWDSQDHKALKIKATHISLYATMMYDQIPIYDAINFLGTCLTNS